MQGLSDAEKKGFGRAGEDLAAQFLRSRGYQILEKNYRCRLGEIDLIVQDGKNQDIHFVEVKTRHSVASVSPYELVPYGKQRRISRAAQHYIAAKRLGDVSADFAVLIVDYSQGSPQFELIENAFPLAWGF